MRCKNAHFFLFLFYYIFSYHPLHYIINQKMLQILIEQHRDYSSLPSWNIFFKWCISLKYTQILKLNLTSYTTILLLNVFINSFIYSRENFTAPRKNIHSKFPKIWNFAENAVMNIYESILECGFADLICLDSSIH